MFEFITEKGNQVEFDYTGEGVFNVKVNGKPCDGALVSGPFPKKEIIFHKKQAVIIIPDNICEEMNRQRDFFID